MNGTSHQKIIGVGFLSYEDFLNEVIANGVTVIRLQDYYRSKPTSIGAAWVDHYVEVSARAGDPGNPR